MIAERITAIDLYNHGGPPRSEKDKSRMWRKVGAFALGLVVIVALVVAFFRPSDAPANQQPLSTFLKDARAGAVASIRVDGDLVNVMKTDRVVYETRKEEGMSIITLLNEVGTDPASITIEVAESGVSPVGLVLNFLPILLFIAFIVWTIRKTRTPSPR